MTKTSLEPSWDAFDAWYIHPRIFLRMAVKNSYTWWGERFMGIRSADPRDISWNIHNYPSIDRFFCSMIGAKSFIGNHEKCIIYIYRTFLPTLFTSVFPNNTFLFDSFISVISFYNYILVNSFIFLRFFLSFIWYNRITKYLSKKVFFLWFR